jgi:O-antigen/teichoic acid export membrane protein
LGVAAKVLVVCLTVKLQLPPIVGAAAALVESLIVSFVCLFLYRKNVAKYKFTISDVQGSFLKEASLEGLKYWPGLVAMTFALKADRILLASAMKPEQFGAYAAGMSLFEQFTTIGTSIVAVAGPIYIYRATETKIRSNFIMALIAMVAISVAGGVVLYALTPLVIQIVYGAKFAQAIEVFRTALLFAPLVFLELAASTLIVKNKMPWIFSFKWIAATVFCLIALQLGRGPMVGVYAHVLSWFVAAIVSVCYAVTYLKCIRLKEVESGT